MLRKIWSDPVWSKVISAGIIAVLLSVWAYLSGYVPVFMACLRQVWMFATSYSSVPNWALGVGGLLALATLIRIVALAWPNKPETSTVPKWKRYRKDSFFGVVWAWDYNANDQPSHIHVLCPECQCQIAPVYEDRWPIGTYYHFDCDACGHKVEPVKGVYEEIENRVIRFVQKKLRTGEWADVAL